MLSFILGILPIVLSFIVLGAHFLRTSDFALVALCALVPLLLFIPRPWVARTIQAALALAVVEWLWTLVLVVQERMAFGAPYRRAAIILAAVALFTAASAFSFRLRALRSRYGLDHRRDVEETSGKKA